MMGHMKGLHMVTWVLVIIGGINWLLLGVFGWEIGELFGGPSETISRIIYVLVGLSALYELFTHGWRCRECKPGEAGGMPHQSGM